MTQLSKYGGETISAPGSTIKKKDNNQKVVWGIPKSDPFKTFVNNTQTTTKSSTAPVAPITRSGGSSYNPTSNNPTAANITPASPGATGTQQGSNAPVASSPERTKYEEQLAAINKSAGNLQTAFNSCKEQNNKRDE